MTQENIPKRLKCKDNHPTMVKLMKLNDLAQELGISIEFLSHKTIVTDSDRDPNLPHICLEDIEEGISHYINSFPLETEFRLVDDNPKYLEEEKKLHEEQMTKIKALADKARAEEEARKKEAEEAKKREIVAKEMQLLAELKAKYESRAE